MNTELIDDSQLVDFFMELKVWLSATIFPFLFGFYGFIPLLSLGAILFPHFNTASPEVVTRTLGWGGLVTVSVILCVFKFFIW